MGSACDPRGAGWRVIRTGWVQAGRGSAITPPRRPARVAAVADPGSGHVSRKSLCSVSCRRKGISETHKVLDRRLHRRRGEQTAIDRPAAARYPPGGTAITRQPATRPGTAITRQPATRPGRPSPRAGARLPGPGRPRPVCALTVRAGHRGRTPTIAGDGHFQPLVFVKTSTPRPGRPGRLLASHRYAGLASHSRAPTRRTHPGTPAPNTIAASASASDTNDTMTPSRTLVG